MKITIQSQWGGAPEQYNSLQTYARRKLDGSGYERGVLEAAERTAGNATEALGRLLDVLAGKGLLTAAEVVTVVEPFTDSAASFEDI